MVARGTYMWRNEHGITLFHGINSQEIVSDLLFSLFGLVSSISVPYVGSIPIVRPSHYFNVILHIPNYVLTYDNEEYFTFR
jgi:hypothetical protein